MYFLADEAIEIFSKKNLMHYSLFKKKNICLYKKPMKLE